MTQLIGIIAGILPLVAAYVYIQSILKGVTRPERGAMVIWAITSTISFAAYWASGAQESIWFAFGDFLVGIVMLFLAIKYGYGWSLRRHIPAFIAVLVGLGLWAITNHPFLALLCSIGVDAIGSVLVAVKAYEAPETEHLGSWLTYLGAALLAVLVVGDWNLQLLSYPLYAVISTLAIVLAVLLGRKHGHRRRNLEKKLEERIP